MTNVAFPYPGNKARHAEWILQYIPEHTCYVEPFGGAAGVLFNKPRSKVEVYNDIDGDIVHFFRVLREQPSELKEWLDRVPFARELHDEWKEEFYNGERPTDDIERAGRFFALRYMQFGGKYYGTSGFSVSCRRQYAGAFVAKTEALDEFAERLRGVRIECESWEQMFERYDNPETVFYIDPPYIGTEYQYGNGSFDHKKLYEAVANAESKCLVSYDSVPPFYGNEFQVSTKSSSHNIDGRGGNKDATETLLMNFDSGGQKIMSSVGQQEIEDFL